jgi:hypothetical protein
LRASSWVSVRWVLDFDGDYLGRRKKGSLTGEQKIRYEARLSVNFDPHSAIIILSLEANLHSRKEKAYAAA